MGQEYLIDTNAIVDYLENKLPAKSNDLIDNITIQLSVISRIEILVWDKASGDLLTILNDFISSSIVFDLTESIVLEAVAVRKKYRLKLPDAIIAATAIVNNLTLITRNMSDFKKIARLKSVGPHKM